MYFYQTLNQFGPSAVGFLVWEMSSPAVKREEQSGGSTQRAKGSRAERSFIVGWGHSTGTVRVEIEGFCIFQWEFGLQETLLSCPGGRWQSRGGKGMWDGFVVDTALLKGGQDPC